MTRKLDYRWNLRQVMATRGMFETTDLIEPLAAAGYSPVLQPGLPAGGGTAGAAEPEGIDGAAGHPRLHDGGADRADRRRHARPARPGRRRRRPGSEACGPNEPASPAPGSDRCPPAWHPKCSPTRSASLVDLVAGLEPALDRALVAGCGREASRRPREAAPAGPGPARQTGGVGRRPVPGTPGRRGPADRLAQGRRHRDLAAGLRRVRQGAAHFPAPR